MTVTYRLRNTITNEYLVEIVNEQVAVWTFDPDHAGTYSKSDMQSAGLIVAARFGKKAFVVEVEEDAPPPFSSGTFQNEYLEVMDRARAAMERITGIHGFYI